jgi:CheY-like chemotaxis protein
MSIEFELLRPEDKPALLAISTPAWLEATRDSLSGLGYKVHHATDHDDFLTRFAHVQYQVVVLEASFGGASSPAENRALESFQQMPMALRRHTTAVLLGEAFTSLHPMQAFQQSVHAVVNPAELPRLAEIVQKVVADNTLFLHIYRDTQLRIVAGKL